MVRLFLRSGKVVAVLGASGGTKITTAVAQVVNHIDRDHHCFCCSAVELCGLSNLD